MKVTDIIFCGLQDLRSQRRKNRISFVLIFLSLIAYIGVNSTVEAIDNAIYDNMNGHYNRIITNYPIDNWEKEHEYLYEKYKDDDRIEEITIGPMNLSSFKWNGTKEMFGTEEIDLRMSTFYSAILESDYKGEKREPEYGEIILPRYIFDAGIYDEYTYFDCDKLIGKTIKITMNPYRIREYTYEFKVIGTYDNVLKQYMYQWIIGSTQAREIWEVIYECRTEKNEKYNSMDDQKLVQCTNFIIKEGYDIDKVYRDMIEETEEKFCLLRMVERSEEIKSYNKYVQAVGNIVSYLMLLIAVMNIVISSISEVKNRKWEYALKMSMGYRRKDIIKIFAVEKIANVIKALIVAVIVLGVYDGVLTYYYKNMEVYWKRSFEINIAPVDVLVAMVLVIIAALMGVITARFFIKGIKISKTLKNEE